MAIAESTATLHPQTQTNLHVAILTVAKIHHLGEVPDSMVGYLIDQMKSGLSPEQRMDPLSVYSPQILGMVEARLEEAYGLDRPANIHAAPQGLHGKDLATSEDAGFFAQDAFGLTRQQRLFGGISNEEHTIRSGTALGAFRTSYADIDPRVWNPSSGAAGLTALNFGGTDFARSGLDLPTTQYLFGQGFNGTQILHAGQDAQALGLNPKDRATTRDFAVLDRADPDGRAQRQDANKAYGEWLAQNKNQITQLQAAIDQAPDEPTRQRRQQALDQLMQQGHNTTGQTAVDARLAEIPLAPGVEPGGPDDPVAAQQRNRRRIEHVNGVDLELVNEAGIDGARSVSADTLIAAASNQEPSDAGESLTAVADAIIAAEPAGEAPTDEELLDEFGVSAQPAETANAKPPAAAPAHTTPTDQKEIVVASTTDDNPGKAKDDQVIEEPTRPATAVASATVKPPAPAA